MTLQWDPDGPTRGTAVLLHGVMSLAATWQRIGPGLAALGWRSRALDLSGHGGMPRSTRPLDLDTLVDGVADRLSEPTDLLVGHSLGAIVALALVARRPEAAQALVLEDPPGRGAGDPGALADGIAADAAIVRHDREQLVRREREANPHWAPEDVEQAVTGIAAADAPSIIAGLRGPLRWDLPALLGRVPVPVLVVAAPEESGGFLGSATALHGADRKAVRARLPAERFVVLEGGHCLHRDDPARWLDVVASFAAAALDPRPAPAG